MPKDLVGTQGDFGVVPQRLGRIFRDRDEARTAERLEGVIAEELSSSQHLIVLCTPAAVLPGSWLLREIELFRQRRPGGPIHAVIGAGEPPGCIPASLLSTTEDGQIEAPLAADLRAPRDGGLDGEAKAVVRLVAGLLGVPFDSLWRREQRRQRIRFLTRIAEAAGLVLAVVALIALAGFYRTHAWVELDPGALAGVAGEVRVVGSEETKENNGSRTLPIADLPPASRGSGYPRATSCCGSSPPTTTAPNAGSRST